MREIKFRAWYNNEMLPPQSIVFLIKSNLKLEGDFPLMQYTGLKDKNGKEIYEGDILRTRQGIGFVVWSDYMYMIESLGSQAQDEMYPQEWVESEITGNIYENPEMISDNSVV